MRWSGNGFILGLKTHNEASYILDVFTEEQGRHKGLISCLLYTSDAADE